MSITNPLITITVDFADTVQEVAENNFAEIVYRLQAKADNYSINNDAIDDALTALVEQFYEVESGSDTWKRLSENYEELIEEQTKNLAVIRECEATIELIEKFAEIRGWR